MTGGFSLACDWLGIETILHCEIDDFCQKVLRKHYPNVPIVKDVNNVREIQQIVTSYSQFNGLGEWRKQGTMGETSKTVGKGRDKSPVALKELSRDIGGGNNVEEIKVVANAAGEQSQSRVLVTAGFPCQPFSNAGRKRGASDNRYLWPHTLKVIEAIQPDYVLLENVAGILNMVFPDSSSPVASQTSLFSGANDEIADYDTISGGIDRDLRQAGYQTLWLVIPACAVGAPHRRDRVWIVCYRDAANPSQQGLQGQQPGESLRLPRQPDRIGGNQIPDWQENWYEVASEFCGVFNGLSEWMDGHYDKIISEVDYDATSKSDRIEGVRILREAIQSEQIRERVGGILQIPEKEVLFSFLLHFQGEPFNQGEQMEGEEVDRIKRLRSLWDKSELKCSPQRRGLYEQRACELVGIVPKLSLATARTITKLADYIIRSESAINSNRVDRLKALGNAIVPEVAYQVIKAIQESEGIRREG